MKEAGCEGGGCREEEGDVEERKERVKARRRKDERLDSRNLEEEEEEATRQVGHPTRPSPGFYTLIERHIYQTVK